MPDRRIIILVIVIGLIVGAIMFLESQKSGSAGNRQDATITKVLDLVNESATEKAKRYDVAKEITNPDGFINTDSFTIEELIGKKVILVDFWTYSCINCQRTTPYLNAWYEKYRDEGLEIVGIHTPEFEFEKDYNNVTEAVEKFGIEYPVVLDNNRATWYAYKNRYWPRKYLIDIDGFIVYDHIGEGGYEETEKIIQQLLEERKERLQDTVIVSSGDIVTLENTYVSTAESPEVYFGAWRNELLANGESGVEGSQSLAVPQNLQPNALYLGGTWNFKYEFATNEGEARIVFPYTASKVHMVASASSPVTATVYLDGKPVGQLAGSDVDPQGQVTFNNEQLYDLVNDPQGPGSHVIEIRIHSSGLEAYTFTFG